MVLLVHPNPEAEAKFKKELANHSYVQPWMVEEVLRSLPHIAERETIEEALEAYKGNINNAVSSLLSGSSQSSDRSSSIERDPDSDDETERKPKKKIDRRPSRPLPLSLGRVGMDPIMSKTSLTYDPPDPARLSAALRKLRNNKIFDPDETEEEDWQNDSTFRDSETTSISTSSSDSPSISKAIAGPVVRIKLSQPKKPIEKDSLLSNLSKGCSKTVDYDADGEKKPHPRPASKTKRRLITGAERDRLQTEKSGRRTSLCPTTAKHKKSNQTAPVIDVGIKILRI